MNLNQPNRTIQNKFKQDKPLQDKFLQNIIFQNEYYWMAVYLEEGVDSRTDIFVQTTVKALLNRREKPVTLERKQIETAYFQWVKQVTEPVAFGLFYEHMFSVYTEKAQKINPDTYKNLSKAS